MHRRAAWSGDAAVGKRVRFLIYKLIPETAGRRDRNKIQSGFASSGSVFPFLPNVYIEKAAIAWKQAQFFLIARGVECYRRGKRRKIKNPPRGRAAAANRGGAFLA